jgi:hypothetical protein
MRNLLLRAAAAALLTCAAVTDVEAQLAYGVYTGDQRARIEPAQFYIFGGRHYCAYDDGWRGPGYYWCGYAWHRGFGWGGGWGWHGWGHGGYGAYRNGGGHFHGGHGGHGGGHHGGGHHR